LGASALPGDVEALGGDGTGACWLMLLLELGLSHLKLPIITNLCSSAANPINDSGRTALVVGAEGLDLGGAVFIEAHFAEVDEVFGADYGGDAFLVGGAYLWLTLLIFPLLIQLWQPLLVSLNRRGTPNRLPEVIILGISCHR